MKKKDRKVRTRLFRNGGSQAVRLPKEYRFASSEVAVSRRGKCVVLEPVDEWSSEFIECLGAWTVDIPRPRQRRLRDAPDPFP